MSWCLTLSVKRDEVAFYRDLCERYSYEGALIYYDGTISEWRRTPAEIVCEGAMMAFALRDENGRVGLVEDRPIMVAHPGQTFTIIDIAPSVNGQPIDVYCPPEPVGEALAAGRPAPNAIERATAEYVDDKIDLGEFDRLVGIILAATPA